MRWDAVSEQIIHELDALPADAGAAERAAAVRDCLSAQLRTAAGGVTTERAYAGLLRDLGFAGRLVRKLAPAWKTVSLEQEPGDTGAASAVLAAIQEARASLTKD
ncbi:MAG: hypothetical protein JSR21_22040 [Proteobacteria bacterium]|nr:hypothetical protein [Pseudomonadota bacterium]